MKWLKFNVSFTEFVIVRLLSSITDFRECTWSLPSCPFRNPEARLHCFYLLASTFLRHLIPEFVSCVSPLCDCSWAGTWSMNSERLSQSLMFNKYLRNEWMMNIYLLYSLFSISAILTLVSPFTIVLSGLL